uniref:Peptidase M20 dimerisation domain-containing protein n=1 Tax=Felis catus TaxID=9685 RepID=A0ABI7X4S2_FELCA
MSALTTLFKYVDENQDRYIKKLAEWVAIQSVSAWPEKRGEIRRMLEVAAADIKQLGGSVELADIGKQKLPDGSEIPLPPILLGKLGSDPRKKTVCIYGHLDVQPAALEDGWDSEPFTLVERDGSLMDKKGKILIPGISEAVAPVTEEELALYDKIDFDLDEYTRDVGAETLLHGCKKDVLMHRWRYPSLSLHGIEGAFSGSGSKTVIPRKVVGKFSIRLVPNMTPEVVSEQACEGAGTPGGGLLPPWRLRG